MNFQSVHRKSPGMLIHPNRLANRTSTIFALGIVREYVLGPPTVGLFATWVGAIQDVLIDPPNPCTIGNDRTRALYAWTPRCMA